jgi:MFS transporter, PAT family, beta-lactamase induction signal transducer AmpG
MAITPARERNPWAWVPSLYFAQGVPYVVVMTVSVIMYKRMGLSNTDIALYTSWLYLPWVIKPLWSPVVELFRTKRFWIVLLQLVIGASLASVALTIPMPVFFQATLAVFWLMAFSSSTHDIAADGFYMLALPQHQQAAFAGVRSTFYRVAMITGQGLLVVLAGSIEDKTSIPAPSVHVQALPQASVQLAPTPGVVQSPEQTLRIVTSPESLAIGLGLRPKKEVDSILARAKGWNIAHGFVPPEEKKGGGRSWWQEQVAGPLGAFIHDTFGETAKQNTVGSQAGNVGVFLLYFSRPPDDNVTPGVTVERSEGDNNIKIAEGERLSVTEVNWNVGAMVVLQLDPNLRTPASATWSIRSGNIPLAWSVTFVVLAALFLLFFAYHRFFLPAPAADVVRTREGSGGFLGEFLRVFKVYFKKPGIVATLAFLLLFRFAESQLIKMVTPFLLDPRDRGGLGLTTSEVGLVYGTVGIVALTLGGLVGGYVVSRQGLKFWLWPMVLIIHLPDLMFVFLSHYQPESLWVVNAAVAVEQFGYGFGFTAYMLYMILVAEGEHKTAHYAICTGFMALGMMIPGMFCGWLQELIGYRHFYLWIALSTVPGFIVAAMVKIPAGFGAKVAK